MAFVLSLGPLLLVDGAEVIGPVTINEVGDVSLFNIVADC